MAAAHLSTPIDAATGPTVSDPMWVLGFTRWAVLVELTGSPTSVSIDLEGSYDGVTWFDMVGTTSTSPTQELGFAPNGSSFRAYPYARVQVNTLSGGSSPTATVTLVGVDG